MAVIVLLSLPLLPPNTTRRDEVIHPYRHSLKRRGLTENLIRSWYLRYATNMKSRVIDDGDEIPPTRRLIVPAEIVGYCNNYMR